MANIDISDIHKLDNQLKKLEEGFKKKLDSYFSEFEKDVLNQISKFKSGKIKKVSLKHSRLKGLERLYKEYFRAIDRLVQRITREVLLKNSKNNQEKERISKFRVDKSKTDYLARAKELSQKQFDDYQNIITEKLKAVKDNSSNKASKQYKDVLEDQTQKFKNIRVSLSAEYESNRIANNIREELGKNSGLVTGILFNAIVDHRTTVHICLPRHKVVLKIDDPRLIFFKPPLHAHCRSYWTYIFDNSGVKFTDDKKIDEIIFLNSSNLIKKLNTSGRNIDENINIDIEKFYDLNKDLKLGRDIAEKRKSKDINYDVINEAEKHIIEITKNKYEMGLVFGEDTKFLAKTNINKIGECDFSEKDKKDYFDKMKVFILTHNHDNGGTISMPDLDILLSSNIKEIRAISLNSKYGDVVFIIRPPSGLTYQKILDLYNNKIFENPKRFYGLSESEINDIIFLELNKSIGLGYYFEKYSK